MLELNTELTNYLTTKWLILLIVVKENVQKKITFWYDFTLAKSKEIYMYLYAPIIIKYISLIAYITHKNGTRACVKHKKREEGDE